MKEDRLLTISEAAEYLSVTRQGVYIAVKQGRLKASMPDSRWKISVRDIDEYLKDRYSRKFSINRATGEKLFDAEAGRLSVVDCAARLGVSTQHIYYIVRTKQVRSHRVGGAIVIELDHLLDYEKHNKQYLDKVRKRRFDRMKRSS